MKSPQMTSQLALLAALTPTVQAGCNADNCLRALDNPARSLSAYSLCTSLLVTSTFGGEPLPTLVKNCGTGSTQTVRASSACSCFLATQTVVPTTSTRSQSSSISSTMTASTTSRPTLPPTSCPAPSTITVTLGPPSTTPTTCAPPSTTTITETETQTAPAPSCGVSSTSSAPSSTATCGPSTDCSSLFLNTGFDDPSGPGYSLTPWYVYHESSLADVIVSVERNSITPNGPAFSNQILRVANPTSGFRAFGISQIIHPCPGVRYYLRASFFCGGGCQARSSLYAFMDTYERVGGPGRIWTQRHSARTDYPSGIAPGQVMSLAIGLDNPYLSPGPREGVEIATELHIRFGPASDTASWTLWFDNVEMIAVPE